MKKQTEFPISIFDQLSIGLLVFNDNNELLSINDAAQALLDISERQAVGVRAEVLFQQSGFDILKGIQHCRKFGGKLTEHLLSIKSSAGTERNISLSMTPLTLDEKDGAEVLVEIVDLNHFLQVDQEEQLLTQNKLATDMLRGLAHEIKNPLGGLRGAAQLLSKELNGEYSDYTQVIIDEADRLRNLVDRMLGSSELPNHQEINVHVIMERVRQLVEAEVDSDNIKIISDYDPSIPDIQADKDQLIQSVLNVVRNAAQAVKNGGEIILKTRIHRNLTIGEVSHKLAVKIDVIDNGEGVPLNIQKKIFYPMVTGRTDGTGLGLSIAQTNVHRHNGIIEMTSRPGRTVFSTILPLARKHE